MKAAYGREPLDFRLMVLISLRRARWIIYGTCIGAILFGGIYYLSKNVFNDTVMYTASSDVYVEYSDEIEANGLYINMQTWATLVHNDVIAEYAGAEFEDLHMFGDYDGKVSATLLTSNQIVTVSAESSDPEEAIDIANVYAKALEKFAPEMKEVDASRIIKSAHKADKIGFEDRTMSMVCTGALIGFVLSFLAVLFYFTLDDSVHVPGVIELRYNIPAIGITTDNMRKLNLEEGDKNPANVSRKKLNKTEFYRMWLMVNFVKVTKGMKKIAVVGTSLGGNTDYVNNLLTLQVKDLREKEIRDIDRNVIKKEEAVFSSDDYELALLESVNQNPEAAAKASEYEGVILLIKASDHNGKLVERALDLLRIQEANVVGAILYDTNASLIKQYVFSPLCSSTKKLKEDIFNACDTSGIVSGK